MNSAWTETGRVTRAMVGAAMGLTLMAGCGREEPSRPAPPAVAVPAKKPAEAMTQSCSPETGTTNLCNFKGGPATAKVKVEAYYPGRHEDTLAAVKDLLTEFPDKVQIEIVDWRTEEGLKRRDATGLTCAGVMINGRNAFELEVDGTKSKVLFVRGIDGEWTKADLQAAVRQELAAADGGAAATAPAKAEPTK